MLILRFCYSCVPLSLEDNIGTASVAASFAIGKHLSNKLFSDGGLKNPVLASHSNWHSLGVLQRPLASALTSSLGPGDTQVNTSMAQWRSLYIINRPPSCHQLVNMASTGTKDALCIIHPWISLLPWPGQQTRGLLFCRFLSVIGPLAWQQTFV